MARLWMQFCAASAAFFALTSTASAQQPAPAPGSTEQPKPGATQPGYPQAQPGYPQAQQGYPQAQQGYPQAQQGYPQAQPGYPQAQPGYPPPGYAPAPGNGQYPQQPGYGPYPQQPGYGPYPQQPGYPQGGYPPPGYMYPPPGYGGPYGYAPPPGPPPPPTPKDSSCCRWSVRVNPFDLILRRLTFEAEVKIIGPLAVEFTPSWIFGSPYDGIDEKGYSLGGNVTVYFLSGKAFDGMWLKGHFAYENFEPSFTSPFGGSVSTGQRLSSAVVGGLIGSSSVFGRNGGFILSGGIGIGVALAPPAVVPVPGSSEFVTFFESFDKIRMLGDVGLGIAF